jgi:cytosine/adenosine deaminase-related metal-dependent hydrolase
MSQTTYTARWIFPIATPPLPGGTITIAGNQIAAVGPHGTRAADVDLGDVAILPGFVNAHTHLDLTGARGNCPPQQDFTQWLRRVIAFRRGRTPDQVKADIAAGLTESLRFGTTLIGDISANAASWELLGQSPCHARMFYELLGLPQDRADQSWDEAQNWFKGRGVIAEEKGRKGDREKEKDFLPSRSTRLVGLSPHAPYSVRTSLYETVAASCQLATIIATHLAETQAELELLRSRTGPFVGFLKELNVWDPSGLANDPLDVIQMLPHGIFVHCNYLDPQTPLGPTQSIVVCPRTHAAFAHPSHPFPDMLQRGVRVALGTDSLASNPDLDILAEARHLRRHYPEVEPAKLLRMLTLSGAEALRFGALTGSLKPGKSADLVVIPLADESAADPHDLVLDSKSPVAKVMFRGHWASGAT